MIFDALDSFLFTAAGSVCDNVTTDRTGARLLATCPTDNIDTKSGGVGKTERMTVIAKYNEAKNASGSNSVTAVLQTSTDASTWYDDVSGASQKIDLTTTAKTGVITLPFATDKRYIRVNFVFAGGGGTPQITLTSVDLTTGDY